MSRIGLLPLLILSGWLVGNASARAAPGAIDPTFQTGAGPGGSSLSGIALLPDGKLLISGDLFDYDGVDRRGIARLLPDGALDPAFDPGAGPDLGPVLATVALPDGKVLVGGYFASFNGIARSLLARLRPDGAVDTAFDAELDRLEEGHDAVSSIAVQPDGRIVVAGSFYLRGETVRRRGLVRLHSDGRVDRSFEAPILASLSGKVAFLADRRLLVSGTTTSGGDAYREGLVRLHPDGAVDLAFTIPYPGAVEAFAVQPDGRILIGRSADLYRLLPDGALDPSFATVPSISYSSVRALALEPDGRVLIAGYIYHRNLNVGLARLNADGTLDPTFALSEQEWPNVESLRRDSLGRVLVGGFFDSVNGTAIRNLVRLRGGSAPAVGAGQFRIQWPQLAVQEAAGRIEVDVVRAGGNTSAVSIDYTIAAGSAGAADFSAASGTLHFASGEIAKTIAVTIADDALVEADETVLVTLSNPGGGATLGAQAAVALTIVDDEKPGRLEWAPVANSAGESASEILLTATRNGGNFGAVAVSYTSLAVTAAEGADYGAVSGTLSFAEGENFATVRVPIHADVAKEGRENFTVQLSAPTGGAVLDAGATAAVEIVDDDNPGALDPSFTAGSPAAFNRRLETALELANGKLLIGGQFETYAGAARPALVRLHADGTVDPAFVTAFTIGTLVAQVIEQRDGRLLVRGYSLP